MNKDRRKRVEAILAALEKANVVDETAELASEELEAFENLSEGLQQSDQGQRTEASASALGEAVSCAEQLVQYLEDALSQ